MKKLSYCSVLILFILLSCSAGRQDTRSVDWCRYCANLKAALHSDNAGVRAQAVQHIRNYMGMLDSRELVQPLYSMSLNDSNPQIRRAAGLVLYKMEVHYGPDFLKRHIRGEEFAIAEYNLDKLYNGRD